MNEAREGLPKKKLFKCDSAPPVKRPVGRPRKDSLPGRKNLILKSKASKSCDLTVKKAKKLLNDAIKGVSFKLFLSNRFMGSFLNDIAF